MVGRFTELKEPLRSTMALINKDLPIICLEEWDFLRQIINLVLRPLENITNVMSGERYLTASSVILLTDGLLNVFETLQKQDFMPEIQSVITTINQGIKTRLGDLESSLSLTLATFLDLRFKNLGFSNNQVPERAKMNVIAYVTQIINSKKKESSLENVPKQKAVPEGMSIWDRFEKKMNLFSPVESHNQKPILKYKGT